MKFCTFLLVALFLSLPARAATLELNDPKNRVEFLAIGKPSAIKIRGEMKTEKIKQPLTGKLVFEGASVSGKTEFQLDAFETGIDLRDKHMKEKYLEVGKFPKAALNITEMKLPSADKELSADAVPFSGNLAFHGKEKMIKGTAKVTKKADKVDMTFQFEIPTADFGIETPSYLGIKVTEAVKVTSTVSGQLK